MGVHELGAPGDGGTQSWLVQTRPSSGHYMLLSCVKAETGPKPLVLSLPAFKSQEVLEGCSWLRMFERHFRMWFRALALVLTQTPSPGWYWQGVSCFWASPRSPRWHVTSHPGFVFENLADICPPTVINSYHLCGVYCIHLLLCF